MTNTTAQRLRLAEQLRDESRLARAAGDHRLADQLWIAHLELRGEGTAEHKAVSILLERELGLDPESRAYTPDEWVEDGHGSPMDYERYLDALEDFAKGLNP